MKPSTVFLGEMTNPEVEAFLKTHHTVIVPTGATEQHGPHAPLLTDVLIPNEIARRIAPRIGAVVAPPINYALSYPHVGFTGLVHIRIPTFMALIEDLCVAFATSGFKRIVFLERPLRQHLRHRVCLRQCRRQDVEGGQGVSGELLGRADRRGSRRVLRAEERPARQPRRDLGGDGDQSEPGGSRNGERRVSAVPEVHDSDRPGSHRVLLHRAGSVYWATKSGTWGDARKSSAEAGERYLEAGVRSTLAMLENIENTFKAMPPR